MPLHIQAPDPGTVAAAERSAMLEQTRPKADHDVDLYGSSPSTQAPEGWAQSSRGGFYMTKAELHAFFEEYLALLGKHGHATAREAPDGARPIAPGIFAVPDEDAAPAS